MLLRTRNLSSSMTPNRTHKRLSSVFGIRESATETIIMTTQPQTETQCECEKIPVYTVNRIPSIDVFFIIIISLAATKIQEPTIKEVTVPTKSPPETQCEYKKDTTLTVNRISSITVFLSPSYHRQPPRSKNPRFRKAQRPHNLKREPVGQQLHWRLQHARYRKVSRIRMHPHRGREQYVL